LCFRQIDVAACFSFSGITFGKLILVADDDGTLRARKDKNTRGEIDL
jgi:hypothetical protein